MNIILDFFFKSEFTISLYGHLRYLLKNIHRNVNLNMYLPLNMVHMNNMLYMYVKGAYTGLLYLCEYFLSKINEKTSNSE